MRLKRRQGWAVVRQACNVPDLPPNEVFGNRIQLLLGRKMQVPLPVHNLAVCLARVFCTERRPSDQALEHDRSQTPPVTTKVVAFAAEDFRRYIVRRPDGAVC